MKVNIDFSYLDKDEITEACKICVDAGVDFIKYSAYHAELIVRPEQARFIRSILPSSVGLIISNVINDYSEARKTLENGADRLGITNGVEIINQFNEARTNQS